MAVMLNGAAEKHARALIQAGQVDKESNWSFQAGDGDAMLGTEGKDWASYGKWFLGLDAEANHESKDHYKYPVGKDGKVYRSALIAARQRASQQDATGIFDVAGKLLELIDAGKSSALALQRRAKFDCGFQIKAINEEGVFSGYGSVYDVCDDGDDIVVAGCFSDSLKAWAAKGRMPAMLWQHDMRQPIGVYNTIKEDKTGLYVEGQLALKTQKGAECYELMKIDALSGLSIGYQPTDADYDMKTGVRTISKADLYEISPVTFPMNDQARISAVKSIEEIGDLNGAELYLREVGGVSRSEAKAIVSRLFAIARREVGRSAEESAELNALANLVKKSTAAMA